MGRTISILTRIPCCTHKQCIRIQIYRVLKRTISTIPSPGIREDPDTVGIPHIKCLNSIARIPLPIFVKEFERHNLHIPVYTDDAYAIIPHCTNGSGTMSSMPIIIHWVIGPRDCVIPPHHIRSQVFMVIINTTVNNPNNYISGSC
ncbi:hypothetical protein DSECCO2_85260 [anaerobic digester metagenome]